MQMDTGLKLACRCTLHKGWHADGHWIRVGMRMDTGLGLASDAHWTIDSLLAVGAVFASCQQIARSLTAPEFCHYQGRTFSCAQTKTVLHHKQ